MCVCVCVYVYIYGTGYDTLLLRMIPGDLLSAFPHRQFHTLPGLLDSWAALPNSYPNALHAMQGGSLYHFHNGLWYGYVSLFRRPIIPTTHCSDSPLFRRPIIPTAHSSDHSYIYTYILV